MEIKQKVYPQLVDYFIFAKIYLNHSESHFILSPYN
jgi:hypothetical protein